MRARYSVTPAVLLVMSAFFAGCQPNGDSRILVEDLSSPTPVPDADGDGYRVQEGDCDDSDGSIHPTAPEGVANQNGDLVGDGVDNNCDDRIDDTTLQFDDDQDGFAEVDGDCDDADGQRYPARLDGCDAVDNDCDELIDEDAGDDNELNDSRETATYLGSVSCNYTLRELNLHHSGDVDFFRFDIETDSTCTTGVTSFILDDADVRDFYIQLYREGNEEPEDATSSTVFGNDVVYSDNSGNDATGTYYIEIGPTETSGQYSAVWCNDTVRFYVYGYFAYEF